jgi:hypothetical protein
VVVDADDGKKSTCPVRPLSGQVQGDPDGLRSHAVADDKTYLRFIKRSLRERCVQTGLGLVADG